MKNFNSHQWSLIPGPDSVPQILDSTELQDIAAYSPEEIALAILRMDGTALLTQTDSWWDWQAHFEKGSEKFNINMTLFESVPPTWGGSEIQGRFAPSALLEFWRELRCSHSRIWLHNESCQIFSPEILEQHFGL